MPISVASTVRSQPFFQKSGGRAERAVNVIERVVATGASFSFGIHERIIGPNTPELVAQHFPGFLHEAGRWLSAEDRTQDPYWRIEGIRRWGINLLSGLDRVQGGPELLARVLLRRDNLGEPTTLEALGLGFNVERPEEDYLVSSAQFEVAYPPILRHFAQFLIDQAEGMSGETIRTANDAETLRLLGRGRAWLSPSQAASMLLLSDTTIEGIEIVGFPVLYRHGAFFLHQLEERMAKDGLQDYLPREECLRGLRSEGAVSLTEYLQRAAESGRAQSHERYDGVALQIRNRGQYLEVTAEQERNGKGEGKFDFYLWLSRLLEDNKVLRFLLMRRAAPTLL